MVSLTAGARHRLETMNPNGNSVGSYRMSHGFSCSAVALCDRSSSAAGRDMRP